jgi:hypothetical protein
MLCGAVRLHIEHYLSSGLSIVDVFSSFSEIGSKSACVVFNHLLVIEQYVCGTLRD